MSGLTRRVVIASALLAAIVGAAFTILLIAIFDMQYSAAYARQAVAELDTTSSYRSALVDIETGQRGFILTRREAFLQPWKTSVAALRQREHALLLTADDPDELARVRRIIRDTDGYIRDYAVPLVETARRDNSAARALESTGAGKRRSDDLRSQIDALSALYRSEAASLETGATTAAHWALSATAVSLIGSSLLIVFFAGYLTKAITSPVRYAADMAGRLAAGDLSVRTPEDGVGEVGTLERAFNTMAGALERRQDEQDGLRRVATLVAYGLSPPVVFTAVTEEVGRVLCADAATMLRFEAGDTVRVAAVWARREMELPGDTRWAIDRDGIADLVAPEGGPVRLDDFSTATSGLERHLRGRGVRSGIGAPIIVEGELWGVMTALSTGDPLPPETEARLSNFTKLIATAVADAESRAEVAASRARVVATADQTRRRIERDLHDGVQQQLVSLSFGLRTAESEVPAEAPGLRSLLSEIATGLANAVKDLQEIAQGIHPAVLAEGGLGPAIQGLARRSTLPVELDVRIETRRLPETIEVAAYYVVAEALANAAQHAQASAIHVQALVRNGLLALTVRDNGRGGADTTGGSGLLGLADRVGAAGGTITISSPAGEGTSVEVQLPLDQASPALD
jgi:signal transduction histidine kinase